MIKNYIKRRYRKIYFTLFSGKNSKWEYYLSRYLRLCIPHVILKIFLKLKLAKVTYNSDYTSILNRVNYYCKLKNNNNTISPDAQEIKDIHISGQKVYPLDTLKYARYFNLHNKIALLGGDVTFIPKYPTFVKSRPISSENDNSVILKLNSIRHFIILKDKIPYHAKIDKVLWRGRSFSNALRTDFMTKFNNNSLINAGDVGKKGTIPEHWRVDKMTIPEQLKYKFIIALEGNDVASNLKWIMSSNSIAVMPKPRFETWFMEGTLIPDYHYIHIKDDFSDLEDRIKYYIKHPGKAEEILAHAHAHVAQFRNKKNESLISLMTIQKYFIQTNQSAF